MSWYENISSKNNSKSDFDKSDIGLFVLITFYVFMVFGSILFPFYLNHLERMAIIEKNCEVIE